MKQPQMRSRTDAPPEYRAHFVIPSDFARRAGRSRSTISEAMRRTLAPACRGGRIDVAHPVVAAYCRARGINPAVLREPPVREIHLTPGRRVRHPARTAPLNEVARRTGTRAAELRERFPNAIVPEAHVTAEQVAFFAGCRADEVIAAVDSGELARAVTSTGHIDLAHDAVIRFMASRPFKRTPDGELLDAPDGYLSAATVGDEVDADHPVTQIFLARCLARVPTESDIGAAT